ncbi:MAG: GNAT family N-acetyltransferase [Mycobacteriales bacterium]
MTTTAPNVVLRALERNEQERMSRLFFRLSPETIYRRFLTYYSDPTPLRPLLDVDGNRRAAIVAVDAMGEIVGVARYSRLRDDDGTAEIAVVVQDDAQRRGIGVALVTELARQARRAGVRRFTGTMLSENEACARLLRRALPGVVLTAYQGETTLLAQL